MPADAAVGIHAVRVAGPGGLSPLKLILIDDIPTSAQAGDNDHQIRPAQFPGQQIARLVMDGQRVVHEETLLHGMGRVRDIRQSPDGYIYVAIESRDGSPTAVVRLEPAGAR